MATAAISGKDGSVNIGGAITEVKKWDCKLTGEALNATSMDGSGWDEFILGLKGGTGTFETIKGDVAIGAHAAATFAVTAGPSISGAIIITSKGYAVDVAGVVTYSYDFTFNGVISS